MHNPAGEIACRVGSKRERQSGADAGRNKKRRDREGDRKRGRKVIFGNLRDLAIVSVTFLKKKKSSRTKNSFHRGTRDKFCSLNVVMKG